MGGILEAVGVPGSLENRAEMYQRSDPEREKWAVFLHNWHEKYGDEPQGTGAVIDLAGECDLIAVDTGKERAARNAFGRMLRAKADRVFSGYRLVAAGTKDRAARYKVIQITPSPDNGMNQMNQMNQTQSRTCEYHKTPKSPEIDTPIYSAEIDSSDSFDSSQAHPSGLTDPFAEDDRDGGEAAAAAEDFAP
jgi:hypothetical protein